MSELGKPESPHATANSHPGQHSCIVAAITGPVLRSFFFTGDSTDMAAFLLQLLGKP